MTSPGPPPAVFVSYSHRDREWLDRLRVHLKPLERNGTLGVWDDTRIAAGQAWHDEIRRALDAAAVAVLLISADFLASDFIAGEELPPLLAAAEQRGVSILPLYLSPCRVASVPALARLQSVNPLDRPLIAMPRSEQEAVFVRLADAIDAALVTPAMKLSEKIRRRFQEIESTHRARREAAQSPFDQSYLDSLSRGLEIHDKKMALLEELTALDRARVKDVALRDVLKRELAAVEQEQKQLKKEQDADQERVRDLFSRFDPV
jgi:FtsZ-binding cell division protein ZapB